jgi:hypothetical protein
MIMTGREINRLRAGRELDAIVAERVMGWTDIAPDTHEEIGTTLLMGRRPGYSDPDVVPNYSTDIYHTWKLVPWLRERWGSFELFVGDGKWSCNPVEPLKPARVGIGETAELAICRAALYTAENG